MSEANRDEVIPRGAWQFDQEITAVFDDMLQRSIPQYNAMRVVTFEVGRRFVQPGTAIIDMGCSRGQALLPFVNLFLQIKRENGYSESQIDRKRMSLEGVLVPVTARWNEELLHQEGFSSVDCFWRHLNFAGWVAVKP